MFLPPKQTLWPTLSWSSTSSSPPSSLPHLHHHNHHSQQEIHQKVSGCEWALHIFLHLCQRQINVLTCDNFCLHDLIKHNLHPQFNKLGHRMEILCTLDVCFHTLVSNVFFSNNSGSGCYWLPFTNWSKYINKFATINFCHPFVVCEPYITFRALDAATNHEQVTSTIRMLTSVLKSHPNCFAKRTKK